MRVNNGPTHLNGYGVSGHNSIILLIDGLLLTVQFVLYICGAVSIGQDHSLCISTLPCLMYPNKSALMLY